MHNGLSEKVINFRKQQIETAPSFNFNTVSKVAGFIAVSLSLFESNSFIIQAKFEMKEPEHFTKITTLGLLIYGLISMAFGIMSFLAFGKDMQVPIIDNYSATQLSNLPKGIQQLDYQLFMTAKFIILVAMLISYLLYQSKMFQSIESIRDLYRKDESQNSIGSVSLKFTLIVLAVFASVKLPQEIDKVLMVSGGLFGTILLFLFPILIYNKT